MPLTWNPATALSREVPLMLSVADILSASAGLKRLNNDSTAEEALTKVKVGPPEDEWESTVEGRATPKQLQDLVVRVEVRPSRDNPHEVTEADQECPNEGGTFEIDVWRWFSDEEIESLSEQEKYLAFLDCTSSMAHDLIQAASLYDRITAVRVTSPAGLGDPKKRATDGVFAAVSFEADWGDRGGGGGEQ